MKPKNLTFTPVNPDLNLEAVFWVKVPDDYPCSDCKDRGGWLPRIDPSDCPACYGDDSYGGIYCGACEYCCGC